MWRRAFAWCVVCGVGCMGLSGCTGSVRASASPVDQAQAANQEGHLAENPQAAKAHAHDEATQAALVLTPETRALYASGVDASHLAVMRAWQTTLSNEDAMTLESLNMALSQNNAPAARALFDKLDTSHMSKDALRSLEVQVLIAEGRFAEARQRVRAEADRGNAGALADYWKAFDADPAYGASFIRTLKPDGNNSLSALGGGSTVSLKYKEGVNTIAALKPDQDLRQTMYRSEIAYFRLCEILGCSFDVPQNVPVRMKREHFNALYAASTSSKNTGYRSKFDHLIWEKEEDGKFLYATFKAWISPFTEFPVENIDIWKRIVQPNGTDVELEVILKRILVAGRPTDYKNLNRIKTWTQDLTTKDFARQLSDLMLLDFLTNNWDRFSGAADNYGANCHIHPGGLIAIDNGAAFPAWHAPRVVKRLEFVHVFNRELVHRLRMITPEMINDRLFPNPTKEEKKSLMRFWERHEQALKHIDEQIKKYGEQAVLAF